MSLCKDIINIKLVSLSIVIQSYDLWCANDAGYVVQFNYQLLFCQAYKSGQVFTAMPSIAGIPAAPTNNAVAQVPDYTPAVPRNYGNSPKSGAETYHLSVLIMPIIAGTLIISLVFL